jgi:hypothetical protein
MFSTGSPLTGGLRPTAPGVAEDVVPAAEGVGRARARTLIGGVIVALVPVPAVGVGQSGRLVQSENIRPEVVPPTGSAFQSGGKNARIGQRKGLTPAFQKWHCSGLFAPFKVDAEVREGRDVEAF